MSSDLIDSLVELPHKVFSLFNPNGTDNASHINYFNILTKSFLDPIAESYSVLDQVYVDGLDASQVFGQTKIILDGVSLNLISSVLPQLRSRHSNYTADASGRGADQEEDGLDPNSDSDSSLDGSDEDNAESLSNDVSGSDLPSAAEHESRSNSESATQSAVESDDEGSESDSNSQTETKSSGSGLGQRPDVFGLNDGFFDIDDFNKQILAMENDDALNNNGDEEDIDYFQDVEETDEEGEMAYYDDFYEDPTSTPARPRNSREKSTHDLKNGDLNEDEYDNAVGSAMLDLFADEPEQEKLPALDLKARNLSSFEKQQQAIEAEIRQLESELIAEKKWTMKGEVRAKDRPRDSLLDDPETSTLEFDRTAKPVPVITQEITESLEDLIRRRIKNEEFDDLERRYISDILKASRRQKFDLSEQKSAKSLAELYEDDFKGVDTHQQDINEELQKQHDEISELFAKVSHRLDAMCSAHYTPEPRQFKTIDIKVGDTTAKINMEDAQPLHVSSESRLAPQEIYKIGDDTTLTKSQGPHKGKLQVQLKSGLSYSKQELDRDDKQRLRRANKRKRSKEFKTREQEKQRTDKQQSQDSNKRMRVGDVADTLSKAKNVTVIGKKGEMTDASGATKKTSVPANPNNLRL